jgi:hypothetical protein
MPKISKQITVAAPAEAVWEVLGPGFARIGDWATAVPASTALASPTPPANVASVAGLIEVPVAGRVCTTGVRLVPEVTEILTAYDATVRTLTYQAAGMPSFVTTARNTWTVIALDAGTCRVRLDAQLDTRGLFGAIARRLLLVQVGRTSRHLAEDLRHHVEHGTPSPRKQHQLARLRQSTP